MENRSSSHADSTTLPDHALQALTIRQREILHLVQAGQSNREIAEQLGISEGTVKQHLVAVFRHLNVRNRTMAAKMGLLSQQPVPTAQARFVREENHNPGENHSTLHYASAIQPLSLVVARFLVTESMLHRLGSGRFGQVNRILHHLCELAAQRFSGMVQTLPGGLLLLFGLPRVREEDAQRAACTAFWIHRQMLHHPLFAELSEPVPLRICVLSGEAVVSTDGGKTTLHGTLLSHPCLVTPIACGHLPQPHLAPESKEIIRYHALRYGLPTPFFPEGEALCQAVGLPHHPAFQQPDLLPNAPLLGRESEWQLLQEAARQTHTGNSRSLVVVAEAGFGKTRLLQELRAYLRQQGQWQWLEGNCRSMARMLAWYPLTAPLAQLSRCQPEWTQATQQAHILSWLHTYHPTVAAAGEILFDQLHNTEWTNPEVAL
ncbi:MAG: AAA family ATPase, partial [Magnetococcales bacterium]|nr:AAA family ATPase [Magnetococcales bacterium]